MKPGFAFEILARDGAARSGRLHTPHGVVETPAFLPVATYGAVRGVDAATLESIGAQILLANTYHLHERPGEDAVARLGGLHGFTGWGKPWLTDSGGFQVTSLAGRVRVDEVGVAFASPLDGRRRLLTPERAVEVQEALGADLAVVLDECRPLASGADAELASRVAMERTLRWAERSQRAHRSKDQALFGIVQGGVSRELRLASARGLAALGFDGYAHGGLGLGESRERRVELVAEAHGVLPAAAPRYLMGLGRPEDLVAGVAAGVDLFDCVVPTRHARHGVLFTREGTLAVRSARFREDPRPPETGCDCPTCARHTRAYIHHCLRANEMLGARLATVHNLRFTLRLMEAARAAIAQGRFAALARAVTESAHPA
ncbi:MAG TPA: tRNA guanosine(34) transglycosylase Tgt [Myxococcota bacterium]|nr:tRNA guanosine(34) transglycosylase Tgt [Myxococcota bacterium]